jgi:glutamyl-Q tRNA(Asp) synthetase
LDGKKLSKQNSSPPISTDQKQKTLVEALNFLGQEPPNANEFSTQNDLWKWAINNWDSDRIPKVLTREYTHD